MLSRAQLCAFGYGSNAIDARLANGRLHRVHPGVYAVGRPELSRLGEWMAAVLACGDDAVLSHQSAAAHWGIRADGPGRIHVSIPADQVRRVSGIKPHRRRVMPAATTHKSIPVTQPLFTLVDLAASLQSRDLEAAVNEADKLRLVNITTAARDLADHPRTPGIAALKRLLALHQPTDSDLERRFLAIARRAGLPPPRTQARVRGFRVDFYWPDLRLIVETDGLTYHRTPAQQTRDRRRDQKLTAVGLTCLRFTNAQIRQERDEVIATLAAVVARMTRS